MKLIMKGIAFLLTGLVVMGALFFLSAGTMQYWNGWLMLGILFIPMLLMGLVLLVKDRSLLEKRLQLKEKQTTQKGVVALSGLMFLAGYGMYAEVLRENTYLSRTVEVQEDQKVIDTGLYGIVRHPMYTATLLMFLAMPLVLGSVIALAVFLAYPVIIIARLNNEEQVLEEGLKGYTEYKQKVKYRLLPFIW